MWFSDQSIQLPLRNSSSDGSSVDDGSEKASVRFVDLVRSDCAELCGRFVPPWFAWNGHLQTVLASYAKDILSNITIDYRRELVDLPDGGSIALDWAQTDDATGSTPTLVMLHGLTGGSHEAYVRSLARSLLDSGIPYRVVVMNARGCGGSKLTTPRMFTGGNTEDIRFITQYIRQQLPEAPLYAVGFSLGSNILTKFLGQEGESSPFVAAASVGNPNDFLYGSRFIEDGFLGRHVYTRVMGASLVRLFMTHIDMVSKNTAVDVEEVKRAQTIRQFDDAATRKAFGFATVDEYYRDASSSHYIMKVKTPLLMLQASDDPISAKDVWPVDEAGVNPYVIFAGTRYGGHLGWIQGNPITGFTQWSGKALAEYFVAMTKIDFSSASQTSVVDSEKADSALGTPVPEVQTST
ncbi:AB-hydrolase YheT [Ramicandelaber brevisporus]|nr:AB-hydrolase YheT [Ramicandelaber brevisporus]